MDMYIVPKQEEAVEYLLTSSMVLNGHIHVALNGSETYSNGENLTVVKQEYWEDAKPACDEYEKEENRILQQEKPLIQEVKQEHCEYTKPVCDDYVKEEKLLDPLEFTREELAEQASEYEPDSEYESSTGYNDTDEEWDVGNKKKSRKISSRTRKRKISSSDMDKKMKFKKHKISIIEDDDDIVVEGPPYACNICSLTFSMEKSLRAHRIVHKGKELLCDVCNKAFKNTSHIFQHMKSHVTKQQFSCPICFKTFTLKKSFISHQNVHVEKTFECDICKKRFRCKNNIAEHMMVHKEKIRRFPCQICDMAFCVQKSLNRHIKYQHSNAKRKRYRCPNTLCDKSYTSVATFRSHACVDGRRPRDMLPINCLLCDKRFLNKFELQRHMDRYIHIPGKPDEYQCPECGKKFRHSFYDKFVLHVAQKCARRIKLSCDHCPKTAHDKKRLIQHFVKKHMNQKPTTKKVHSCPHCGKMFINLKYHITMKHVKIELKCEYCNKIFKSKGGITLHQKCCISKKTFDKYSKHVTATATKAQSYACKICNFSFITEINLLEHQTEVHLERNFEIDVGKYKCPMCNQSFNSKSSLSKHEKKIHKRKNFKCSSCGGKFIGEEVYHDHLANTDCSQKTVPQYQCIVCSNIYASNTRLRLHFNQEHTKNGTYYHCDICKREFLKKESLQKHVEMGDHRTSWECEFCSKSFEKMSAYMSHRKNCQSKRVAKAS